jgi:hypothetical protein
MTHTHTIESGNARVSVEADDAARAVSEAINDDVFNYEGSGGFSQCISGFGRNAVEQITERIEDAFTDEQGFMSETGRQNDRQ